MYCCLASLQPSTRIGLGVRTHQNICRSHCTASSLLYIGSLPCETCYHISHYYWTTHAPTSLYLATHGCRTHDNQVLVTCLIGAAPHCCLGFLGWTQLVGLLVLLMLLTHIGVARLWNGALYLIGVAGHTNCCVVLLSCLSRCWDISGCRLHMRMRMGQVPQSMNGRMLFNGCCGALVGLWRAGRCTWTN